jgi:hypothetical protein
LVTFVVDATENGAVPVVRDDVNCPVSVNVFPVNVVVPALPMVPVVTMLSDPVSILPNPFVIDPAFNAPTVVKDEVSTPDPSVLLLNTSVPLILYVLPVDMFTFPATSTFCVGVADPIPTFPALSTMNFKVPPCDAVKIAPAPVWFTMFNAVTVDPATFNAPIGTVVPIPTFPLVSIVTITPLYKSLIELLVSVLLVEYFVTRFAIPVPVILPTPLTVVQYGNPFVSTDSTYPAGPGASLPNVSTDGA